MFPLFLSIFWFDVVVAGYVYSDSMSPAQLNQLAADEVATRSNRNKPKTEVNHGPAWLKIKIAKNYKKGKNYIDYNFKKLYGKSGNNYLGKHKQARILSFKYYTDAGYAHKSYINLNIDGRTIKIGNKEKGCSLPSDVTMVANEVFNKKIPIVSKTPPNKTDMKKCLIQGTSGFKNFVPNFQIGGNGGTGFYISIIRKTSPSYGDGFNEDTYYYGIFIHDENCTKDNVDPLHPYKYYTFGGKTSEKFNY